MNMPKKSYASIGGPCYSLDCEFNCPTGFVAGDRVTYPIGFINFGLWGGAKGQFDDEGYIFHTDGLTAGSGHVLSANSRTLRVNIEGADKFIYLSDTEDDLGAGVLDTLVLNPGRVATGSLAGTAATLGATYAYGSGMYLRYAVTDWTGKGSDFTGAYVRAEATTLTAAGKSLYGMQIYGSTQQTMTTGSLWGALIYAYKKGNVTATINNMYAVQAELTWDAAGGTTTLTTEAAIILAKVTGGTLADYTKLHGQIFRFGDMNGGSRTYGSGIKLQDDADMSSTCLLTTGLNIAIGATDGILIAGDCSDNGIEITGSCTDSAFQIATGTFGTGIKLGGTITTGIDVGAVGTGINFSGTIGTSGINFSSATMPVASDNVSLINIGTYDAGISSGVSTDNTFAVMNNRISTADDAYWFMNEYMKISVTTADQTSKSFVNLSIRQAIGKPVAATYGIQSHLTFSGTGDTSSEVIALSAQIAGTHAGSGYHWGVKSDLRHTGCPSGGGHLSACFFGVGTVDVSCGMYREPLAGKTMYSGVYIHGAGTVTNAIETVGTVTNMLAIPASAPWAATNATGDGGKIAITIGGSTKYLNVYNS